ncbi:glycoside hydrolase family 95 protein [Paenibacillus mucilaginosus]|uniref:Alpha-L-fucosidase n=1 Tax=Paenibacillus mucilaginosus (strain KNP414) TaxID=1036673 RepID=F8FG17_PAEMK|nr:glycoside hydrolase family 95 protein [Paenibacillus mucilaginosus]AEI43279.1 Alpha-L-fucosidase [Paenibacillus mucilaginosus KNP414]MCG7212166.1 glycoside hydrolase family 95 protein [Paenibacillus mucilaginosus]WDM24862.1 glycoside hydrolase family 95 protein [Paenibacillus mucilaginosus]
MRSQRERSVLWYEQPAGSWFEALPAGNGRLGAMVFGGTCRERIALNEDTLWSGEPRDTVREDAHLHLDPARKLIFEGRHAEAEEIIEQYMQGPDIESYLPLGDLELQSDKEGEITDYRRELILDDAVIRTQYRTDGALQIRELFVSAADQVLALRIESEQPLNLTISLGSPLQYAVRRTGSSGMALSGRCPVRVLPNTVRSDEPARYEEGRGIAFEAALHVTAEKGRIESSGGRIRVVSGRGVTLLLAAATSYDGFDRDPAAASLAGRPRALCAERLREAAGLGYSRLKERHLREHAEKYGRVDLELGGSAADSGADADALPTDARIRAAAQGADDPGLAALFFQYGRYLLLSSSRPGTQPANLQGIWNDKLQPPWCSSWTANINVQMNYWPAEAANLAECHEPLLRFVDDLRESGRRAASVHYRCRGWTAHHNIDLWRTATPVGGSPSWAFWPMAGAWLCEHLWEHYAFSRDEEYLARVYPVLKEAAQFGLDWLVEGPDGFLVTCPSTSPENHFLTADGSQGCVTYASTMDIALLRNLFGRCMEASRQLQKDTAFRELLEQTLRRMPPYRIGRHGQLQEWAEDFGEAEPGHRHTAHLAALHPLEEITPEGEPELAEACRKALERRLAHGGAHTGWSCAWMISLWARLGEPETAHRFLGELLAGLHPNLTNAHRHPKVKMDIFQIDGSLAGTAGILEMLLQSHRGTVRLLPALPENWREGRVRGLRARGGFEIDMEWKDGRLIRAALISRAGQPCRLSAGVPVEITADDGALLTVEAEGETIVRFPTEAGRRYEITAAAPNRASEPPAVSSSAASHPSAAYQGGELQ